ncbi:MULTISPECIES: PfkB family carbohydrate kinase [unclassified Mesorhizobium]|uniref:PfkB family carbohydrate kinase n=2 Tax=Mesorhizobium TaxID=68287 RepID=UPI000F755605|nr:MULTISPECIES: PfkB family carbohydrate kinase [unclassified Mesorhizobium]AZO03119.1 permease [Mesorhizobium sp. M2A.F.Ca.ET.043.02.1.1]RUW43365.1 permease [Mesorhizobium sp. M2A.F.Ca.ET.015.02.1.1]RUW76517.1 permease [Mesorhizobium sp. M2A.F.Ca.ET.067.02.1.1]RVC96636.1 permease [Mesorhizobium sp. M2A.F.Ca.ET.029.05.1.1]RWB42150.1 MAG: permease [Mesorhizobium sp.]
MRAVPSILGFGAIAIDDIVYVDQPLSAGKGKVLQSTRAFGGNVATALAAVARLGGSAGFIGWLGSADDDAALCDLVASGVETAFAPRHPDARPVRSRITVGSDGDRFIAYDDDAMLGTAPDFPDDILSRATVLIVDSYAIRSLDAVARARDLGLAILGDVEWSAGPATDRLMALCDHLILPLGFARTATGCRAPAEMLDALWSPSRSAVVLTDGGRGVYYRGREETTLWHLPPHRVAIVDSTGAGDCFHGAYAHALTRGADTAGRVALAAAAAALSITGRGGREALPTDNQVTELLASASAPSAVEVKYARLDPGT